MHPTRKASVAALAALGIAMAGGAAAHHGWSGYDASKLLTLAGTVQSAAFQSPHAMLTLDADGKVWRVVLAPPSRMERRGLASGSIEAGEQVSVEGYAHRDEVDELRAERITVKGSTIELR
jgi:Family of unknown function (DUF6152)